MKKFIRILVILAVILILCYLAFLYWPKANIKNKDASSSHQAAALYQEFESNESTANTKYIGKVINVTGTILKKTVDEKESPVVLLSDTNNAKVMVTLEANQAKKLEPYKQGDNITIKGLCSGKLIEVVLNKGIIVE